jgi:hypothetical protein
MTTSLSILSLPIPDEYITASDWEQEVDLWMSGHILSVWIAEPTSVKQLVSEIVATGCFLWWDEHEQQIRLRAVRPYYALVDGLTTLVNDQNAIIKDTVERTPKPDERVSQVMFYWDQINPTAAIDEVSNYNRSRTLIDQAREEPEQYGSKKIHKVFARFLGETGDAATLSAATRILERSADTPLEITFKTDAKDNDIKVGDIISFAHRDIIDFEGAPANLYLQIIRAQETDPGHEMEFMGMPLQSADRYAYIMDDSTTSTYSTASDDEKANGAYIAPDVTGFDNLDPPYKMI